MTQADAITILRQILGWTSTEADTCTRNAETCPNDECLLCGIRDCPAHEPLHYHHDGCPSCDGP